MSLYKKCTCPGRKCDHHWWYSFYVNKARFRATTETADKQVAKRIESKEHTRILEGRHGIRQQPDITFAAFAATYLRDYAVPHTRSGERETEVVARLNEHFGAQLLHEVTTHRILQWQRARLAGTWKAHGQKDAPKPVKKGTVNRELDTLKLIFNKAVEWGVLLQSPAAGRKVRKLQNDNRKTRILSPDEQTALLAELRRNDRTRLVSLAVALALYTGARIGEVLALRWDQVTADELVFLKTKNGKARTLPRTPTLDAILGQLPKGGAWLFPGGHIGQRRADRPYTVGGLRHVFNRACDRAGVVGATPHTLRHTRVSELIANGADDFTVMEISGHSDTRMLARYTHPTIARRAAALELPSTVGTIWSPAADTTTTSEDAIGELSKDFIGGRQEARTPDLRVANGLRATKRTA